MKPLQYLSLDVRFGAASIQTINPQQIKFHELVAKKLFPNAKTLSRNGSDDLSSINHRQIVYKPNEIQNIILSEFRKLADSGVNHVDFCLIDFTGNPFVSIRDPLLLALSYSIIGACEKNECKHFAILLPELPGEKSASVMQFKRLPELISEDFKVVFLANDGERFTFSSNSYSFPDIKNDYINAIDELYGNPEFRLEQKCIRRLGHFQNHYYQGDSKTCRPYSYYMYDCSSELKTLFDAWWQGTNNNYEIILFDLRNNSEFREAIVAFAEENVLRVERIIDVLDNKIDVKDLIDYGEIVLVLDVVDSGTKLKQYVEALEALGLRIAQNIAVAINKTGSKTNKIGDFKIHGFLSKPVYRLEEECIQCKLGLPFSDDRGESFMRIRSYDMHYMVNDVGWESEPKVEVPKIGLPYPKLPIFSKMLNDYGDWIVYKMYMLLRDNNLPDSWFIIRPDEPDAMTISENLQRCTDYKITVISVPKKCINDVQSNNDKWETVLPKLKNAYWVEQIKKTTKDSSALILDIINASDSTALSLINLVTCFDRNPFAYSCIIDYMPASSKITIPKNSLYKWNNPRHLV